MFLVAVPDREAKTLFKVMQKYIRRNSKVTVDGWRGYRPIDFAKMNWDYQMVKHSENFVDPQTGFNTNTIG